MSSFDLRRSLRRIKPNKQIRRLVRRPLDLLPFIVGDAAIEHEVLIDTTVYIDVLQGRAPRQVESLLVARSTNHCAHCLAELLHAFGRLNPADPRTAPYLRRITQVTAAIPAHRLASAGVGVVTEAGILAGLLCRLGDLQPGSEVAAMNDATIYLQALSEGQTVLTRNIRDFDLLNQIVPAGRVLFYEQAQVPRVIR